MCCIISKPHSGDQQLPSILHGDNSVLPTFVIIKQVGNTAKMTLGLRLKKTPAVFKGNVPNRKTKVK